jgi:hypothetical protein
MSVRRFLWGDVRLGRRSVSHPWGQSLRLTAALLLTLPALRSLGRAERLRQSISRPSFVVFMGRADKS